MPITRSPLTANSSTSNVAIYTTDPFTPTANRLVLASVAYSHDDGLTDPVAPSLTGNNLTWVLVTSNLYKSSGGSRLAVAVYRAMGTAPTLGTLLISFAGITASGCIWAIEEFDGVTLSGTNGSGAVIQSVVGTDSSSPEVSGTLAAFQSTFNRPFAAFSKGSNVTDLYTVDATGPWTKLSIPTAIANPNQTLTTGYRSDAAVTSTSWTHSAGNANGGSILLELSALATYPVITNSPTVYAPVSFNQGATVATLDYMDGFEHRSLDQTTNGGLWNSLGNTGAISFGVGRLAGRCLQIVQDGITTTYVQRDIEATPTKFTFSGYFRLYDGAPNVQSQLMRVTVAGTNSVTFKIDTQGRIRADWNGAGVTVIGPIVSDNTWHRLGFSVDVSTTGVQAIHWRVDGVAQADSTITQNSATLSNWRLGSNSATDTLHVRFDDVVMQYDTVGYPLGQYIVGSLQPNVDHDKTHLNGHIVNEGGSTALMYNSVANAPPNLTTYINQTTIGASDYLELGFSSVAQTPTDMVGIATAFKAGGNAADHTGTFHAADGTTLAQPFTGNAGNNQENVSYAVTMNRVGADWTSAAANGVLFRYGFSTDVTPIPRLSFVMIQYAYPAAADTGVTLTLIDNSYTINAPNITQQTTQSGLAATELTADSSTTNGTSFTTGSINPQGLALILAIISYSRDDSGTPAPPTITANGLTWVEVNSVNYKLTGGTSRDGVSVFRAMGTAPTPGTMLIDFGADTYSGCIWSIIQVTGTITTGTNGSGAVVQSVTGNDGNSPEDSGLLGTFTDVSNRPLAVFSKSVQATDVYTVDLNWLKLSIPAGIGNPTQTHTVGWRPDGGQRQTSWTHLSSNAGAGSILLELANGPPGLRPPTITNSPTLFAPTLPVAAGGDVQLARITNSYTIFSPVAGQVNTGTIWEQVGPRGGGGIMHVSADPNHSGVWIVAKDVGGPARSTDGKTWIDSQRGLWGERHRKNAVVEYFDDPANPGQTVGYGGFGDRGADAALGRTLDLGLTWEHRSAGPGFASQPVPNAWGNDWPRSVGNLIIQDTGAGGGGTGELKEMPEPSFDVQLSTSANLKADKEMTVAFPSATTVFLGGDFDTARNRQKTQSFPRTGLVKGTHDGTGYQLDTTAAHDYQITGGRVWKLIVASSTVMFVLGDFTSIKGSARGGIAAINPVDGTLLSLFSGWTRTGIYRSGDYDSVTGILYVGGTITNVNGTAVNRIAKITAATTAPAVASAGAFAATISGGETPSMALMHPTAGGTWIAAACDNGQPNATFTANGVNAEVAVFNTTNGALIWTGKYNHGGIRWLAVDDTTQLVLAGSRGSEPGGNALHTYAYAAGGSNPRTPVHRHSFNGDCQGGAAFNGNFYAVHHDNKVAVSPDVDPPPLQDSFGESRFVPTTLALNDTGWSIRIPTAAATPVAASAFAIHPDETNGRLAFTGVFADLSNADNTLQYDGYGFAIFHSLAGAQQSGTGNLYLGSWSQGVHRSTNGGLTTTGIALTPDSGGAGTQYYCRALAFDPNDHTTLWVGTDQNGSGGGLWKVTNADGTASQTQINLSAIGVTTVEDIFFAGTTMILVAPTGIFRANAPYTSFTNITPMSLPANSTHWKTIDARRSGANWIALVGTYNPPNVDANGNLTTSGNKYGSIYRTSNIIAATPTWTYQSDPGNNFIGGDVNVVDWATNIRYWHVTDQPNNMLGRSGATVNNIVHDPINPGVWAISGAGGAMWRSEDDGLTWRITIDGLDIASQRGCLWDPVRPGYGVSTNQDHDFMVTYDYGDTWIRIDIGGETTGYGIHIDWQGVWWLGHGDSTTHLYRGFGNTGAGGSPDPAPTLNLVEVTSPGAGRVVGVTAGLLANGTTKRVVVYCDGTIGGRYSDNNGSTWTSSTGMPAPAGDNETRVPPFSLVWPDRNSGNVFMLHRDASSIVRSTDRGASWTDIGVSVQMNANITVGENHFIRQGWLAMKDGQSTVGYFSDSNEVLRRVRAMTGTAVVDTINNTTGARWMGFDEFGGLYVYCRPQNSSQRPRLLYNANPPTTGQITFSDLGDPGDGAADFNFHHMASIAINQGSVRNGYILFAGSGTSIIRGRQGAITTTGEVDPPRISNPPTLFEPQPNIGITDIGDLTNSPTLFAPTQIGTTVTLPLINRTGVANAPTLPQTVTFATIDRTGVTLAPGVLLAGNVELDGPIIITPALFAPVFPQTVAGALITNSPTLFQFTATGGFLLQRILNTPTVFAPTLFIGVAGNQTVTLGVIVNTPVFSFSLGVIFVTPGIRRPGFRPRSEAPAREGLVSRSRSFQTRARPRRSP